MRTKKLATLLWNLSLSLLVCLALNGCQTVEILDARTCAVAGILPAGMNCTHLIGAARNTLTFHESLEFLSAAPERSCAQVPGMNICWGDDEPGPAPSPSPVPLPARGAAICESAADYSTINTELATMCRIMGKSCSYAVRAYLTQRGFL